MNKVEMDELKFKTQADYLNWQYINGNPHFLQSFTITLTMSMLTGPNYQG